MHRHHRLAALEAAESRDVAAVPWRCCCCAGDVAAVAAVGAAPAAADDDDKCSLQRNRKVATMCVCVTDDNDR